MQSIISPEKGNLYTSLELPAALRLSPGDLKVRNIHRRTLSSINTQAGTESRNSSLQKLWAEDYYDSENEEGRTFDYGKHVPNILAYDSVIEEASLPQRPVRSHQRSLTALLPFRNAVSRSPDRKSNSSASSPCREVEVDEFMPTFTGDKDRVVTVADRSKGGLSSWFTGTSAPVPVGIELPHTTTPDLSPSPSNMSLRETSPERGKLKKRAPLPMLDDSASPSTPTRTNTTTTPSRFGAFFSSPKTPSRPNTIQLPASQALNNPLLTDLISPLYPNTSENETFSPAAYKNLQIVAEGTILRLQTAYKLQLALANELAAERDAIREEKEEVDIRVKCLLGKIDALQLQDAEKTKQLEESENVTLELMVKLSAEQRARAEEKEVREKSIALVSSQASLQEERKHASKISIGNISIGSTGEDLGFMSASARRSRDSANSLLSIGGDSDVESGVESVFSRSRSPTLTVNTNHTARTTTAPSSIRSSLSRAASSHSATPSQLSTEIHEAKIARVVPNPSLNPSPNTPQFLPRPKSTPQKSTFQKLLAGMAGVDEQGSTTGDRYENIGMGTDGCANCRGETTSAAWDAVGLMRAENKGLKDRIGQLEEGMEDVMDMIRIR